MAQVPGLGYLTRNHPYNGWSGIVKGDNNTVGMAGATVAVPNSISSMQDNPAGYAMDLGGLAAQVNAFQNRDPYLKHGDKDFVDYEWGAGTAILPWGYGISYYSPDSERADTSEVSVRQLRLTLARMLGQNASIGVSLGMAKGIRKFEGNDYSGTSLSAQVGGLYKLSDTWVLGGSYTPGIDIGPTNNSGPVDLNSFNQTVKMPSVFVLGLGFQPNRFFKAGLSVLGVTGTSDTSLLYDQDVGYGRHFSLQPRIGASYVLGEWNFLKVELAAGSYYEVSRIDGVNNRTHGTFGLDVNPWFVNSGIGTDLASHYVAWNFSIGIDLVRAARTFQIIPPDPVPFFNGSLPPVVKPDPNGLSDGLTKGMTSGPAKTISPPTANDVANILQKVPEKMGEKIGGVLPETPPAPVNSSVIKSKKFHKKLTKKPSPVHDAPAILKGANPKGLKND